MKDVVVLINLIILGGVWGYAPPGKFQSLRLFLVASEHSDGEAPVSNIHWFPSI